MPAPANPVIECFTGAEPITLYRWDLECLTDVIDSALDDAREYANPAARGYAALQGLGERLRSEYDAVYGDEDSSSPSNFK